MKRLGTLLALGLLCLLGGCMFGWEAQPSPSGGEELAAPVAPPEPSAPTQEEPEEEEGEEEPEEAAPAVAVFPLFNGNVENLLFNSEGKLLVHRVWRRSHFAGFYLVDPDSGEVLEQVEMEGVEHSYIGEDTVVILTEETGHAYDNNTLELLEQWPVLTQDYVSKRWYTADKQWFFVSPGLTFVNGETLEALSYGEVEEFTSSSAHGLIGPETVVYRQARGDFENPYGTEFIIGILSRDGSVHRQAVIDEHVADVRGGKAVFAGPLFGEEAGGERFRETVVTTSRPDYQLSVTEIPNEGGFRLGYGGEVIGNALLRDRGRAGGTLRTYAFASGELLYEAELEVETELYGCFSVSADGERFAFATWNQDGVETAELVVHTKPA